MRTLLLSSVSLLAVGASACSPSSPPSSSSPDAAASIAAMASIAAPVVSAPIRDAGAIDAGRPRLDAAQRRAVLRDLEAGRKLARAKDWLAALVVFDRALELAPDDARLLAEVGWAALQAKDLARADAANRRALASTKDPSLRAQILYNAGRVAEARGDKAAAKSAYGDSLSLRDNAEVKTRFTSVGGSLDDIRIPLPCMQGHASAEAMCACLVSHKEDVMTLWDEAPRCVKAKPEPSLGDPRLGLFVWGGETLGEKVYVLTVREGASTRPIADLGRDYEPGAFGVHNGATIKDAEARTVSGHKVVIVRSEQANSDANMGGLELCTQQTKLETVCALADAPGATRCTPPIPIESEGGCGLGAEPDPSELDAEMRAVVAEIKKNASRSQSRTAWTLAPEGKVTVRVVSGEKSLVPTYVLREHALW